MTSTPTGPTRYRLAEVSEHPTGKSKLYLAAIKYVLSNRMVGYSTSDRV